MKNTDQHIDDFVEKTLNAFDGAERAKPKPFLFTRVQVRTEKGITIENRDSILSLVYQRAGLAFFILIVAFNIYTTSIFFMRPSSIDSVSENEQAFVEDLYPSTPTLYSINQTNSNP